MDMQKCYLQHDGGNQYEKKETKEILYQSSERKVENVKSCDSVGTIEGNI